MFAASLQKLPLRLDPSDESCHRNVPSLVRVAPCSVKVRTTVEPSMRPETVMGVRLPTAVPFSLTYTTLPVMREPLCRRVIRYPRFKPRKPA